MSFLLQMVAFIQHVRCKSGGCAMYYFFSYQMFENVFPFKILLSGLHCSESPSPFPWSC